MAKRKKEWIGSRVPSWVLNCIDTYKDIIEEIYDLEINTTREAMLGCGSYGCVFTTSEKEWVLKITHDPTEGPIVQYLKNKNHRGLVQYHSQGAVQLGTTYYYGKKWPIYVYIRENILPLSQSHLIDWPNNNPILASFIYNFGLPFVKHYKRMLYRLGEILFASREFYRVKNYKYPKHYELQQLQDKWLNLVNDLVNFHPFANIGEMILNEFYDEDIIFLDVHSRNIGIPLYPIDSEDEETAFPDFNRVVIFDPGHTPIPYPVEIPNIS